MQSGSIIMMERTIMNLVAVICLSTWMKLDGLNVLGILHIMLIVIVYPSIIFHTYNILR